MSTLASNGLVVAVKKLKQDKKYKSRELQIHKEMHHQNIVRIQHAFFSEGKDGKLNIIMDYIPTNIYRIQKGF